MAGDIARRADAERYELALEAGGAGTWFWDRRSGTVDWDAALETIYGLEPGSFGGSFDEWVGKIHPDERDQVLERLDAALHDLEPHHVLYRTVRPDGVTRWIEARGRALRHGSEVVGMVGVCHDVTERQEARHRLEFLADAGGVLGRSLDVEQTLQELARLAVPRLSDWCTIDLVVDDQLQALAVAHTDQTKVETVRQLRHRYGYDEHGSVAEVVRTGEAIHLPEIADELLRSHAQDPEHLEILRTLGLRSAVIVPLRARQRTLGALTLVHAESGRRHSRGDLLLAGDVAQRAATAIDNARLYEDLSKVAAMLQQALLPQELPAVPGMEVAAHYDTAEHTDIGGDFYDVMASHGGWTVVLGDVRGKGPEAAALTSLVRHSLRAAALRSADPAELLGLLNDALLEHDDDESFCTVVCGHLQWRGDRAELVLATGGHPPPLVVRADGSLHEPPCEGPLIGLLEHIELSVARVSLDPGDLLLLYTDGLSEARRGAEQFGSERIRAAASETPGMSAEAALKHVHAAVEAFQSGQSDDMAMLALRRHARC